jgi:hypothetical protein
VKRKHDVPTFLVERYRDGGFNWLKKHEAAAPAGLGITPPELSF